MPDTRSRHEVPADERARLIREFQRVLEQAHAVDPDSLTARVAPDQLRRTDNVLIKGYIPDSEDDSRSAG